MTTLETRIYTYPPIPLADISPLEMLILTNVLECSETDTGLVLFTDFGPTNTIRVARSELADAYRASAHYAEEPVNVFIASRVLALLPAGGNAVEEDAMLDIDLSQFPWQFVVQGIVARSADLREVTVIQWMNHPSQRPDSYGAGVSLITARAIHHASSEDLLARFRLQDQALPSAASPAPSESNSALAGIGASDPFTVKEFETALCIWEAMLYFRGLHQGGRPVPDTIVRMSQIWDAVGWQAMRSHVRALVPFALDVYDGLFEDLEEGGFTFDFDFVPAFVAALLWSDEGACREGERQEFLEGVMVAVRRHRQDVAAQNASSFNPDPGRAGL
ncbi:hypothetical protein CFBP4996_27130 (plasmid) [Agrobacterium leguminum]|uniref:Uncharacterized protein n=1 Tax=Agrobacterium deltaense NCPPB 1641 TaxID=1183425 RepID=A0A1S7U9D7_9HYPH|nr:MULTISPECIES: hypothetical protein [Agrobacterium]WFS69937.1 hypothetical protein CFBP4996_27130 [Agrobacterium leguminum]CVI63018.1 hypothetical protein AGR7A_pAt20060 [Agrobacterium deltaense NCPPB 1641]